jgi:tetratricopeptide (TPR) repeat protein
MLLFVAAVPVGCTLTRPIPADVRVPPEVLRSSQYGDTARKRYVIRLTDGRNDWEVQVPELATSYEYRIPLSGKPATRIGVDMPTLTAADREIIQQREADARAEASDAEPSSDDGPMRRASTREDTGDSKPAPKRAARKPGDDKAQGPKASYLLTLARVKDLYRAKQYELALVELTELDRQYPDDEHILAMKGSLYERLGNTKAARDAWNSALRINGNNLSVMDALDRLNKKEKGRE